MEGENAIPKIEFIDNESLRFSSHHNLPLLSEQNESSSIPSLEQGSAKRFQIEPLSLPTPESDDSSRPRVKFKMSASIESLEKGATAKSPILKSVLKPFPPHTYHGLFFPSSINRERDKREK